MKPQEEKRKKTIAALTTIGVNGFILLIMLFVAAWQTPGSGPGDYPGIEVNLGYDDYGSGDIEPGTPIGDKEAKDDENPVVDKQEEVSSATSQKEESDVKPLESGTLTDPNSDVEIKEEKKEEKPAEKTPEKKIVEKVEKPAEKKVEEKPKVVDSKAVYKGKTTSNPTNEKGDGKEGTPGNQGDDVGKEGNKGVPGGKEGVAVYKGTPGGGDGGPGLDLYGWEWDNIPKPNIPETETGGRIVFQIEVNDEGELITYRKESGSVSAAAERACVAAIQKLTFTKKSGAKVPPISKGKITFVVRTQ